MKNIREFLEKNGHILMLCGFIVSALSLFAYSQTRHQAAFGCTIAGLVIYLVGRINVALLKYRKKKESFSTSEPKDDE